MSDWGAFDLMFGFWAIMFVMYVLQGRRLRREIKALKAENDALWKRVHGMDEEDEGA